MRITTYENGRPKTFEYTRTEVKPEKDPDELEIVDFNGFKHCLIKDRELQQYAGYSHNNKFQLALQKLLRTDRTTYMNFVAKLSKEIHDEK